MRGNIYKCICKLQIYFVIVAPHVGAWIETLLSMAIAHFTQSRPTWARGLKHMGEQMVYHRFQSRPTWARGLKLSLLGLDCHGAAVAPHVGAWIETFDRIFNQIHDFRRAPRGRVD